MNKEDYCLADLEKMPDQQIIQLGKSIIEKGGSLDVLSGKKEAKFSLLQASTFFVKDEAVGWLTQNNANPNIKTQNGNDALSLLFGNFYNKEENKSEDFWNRFRKCLECLKQAGANFNLPTYDNKKAVFTLLKYEKDKIPSDILWDIFKNTKFNDKQTIKNGDDIFASLMFSVKNFTFENVQFLIEQKKLSLNNNEVPSNSIIFLMSFATPQEMKHIRKLLDTLHKAYPFDFSIKRWVFGKDEMVNALDTAIAEKNISSFKFILKNSKLLLENNYGDLGLAGQCAIMDFIPGLSYALKNYPFNWDFKEDLLNVCDSSNGKVIVDTEYKKFLFNSLSSKLKQKEDGRQERRMKI